MKIDFPLGRTDIAKMSVEAMRREEHELLIALTPTTLVLEHCRPSDVVAARVKQSLIDSIGDNGSTVTTIHKYAVDPRCFYESFYGGGDNQMSPITLVRVWYYQIK